MRLALVIAFFCTAFVVLAQQVQAPKGTEAPTGFDGGHNGLVGEEDFLADKEEFEGVEGIKDGLGPVYNAQSCRECHQNPITGGASQVTELRERQHRRTSLASERPGDLSGRANAGSRLREHPHTARFS